VTATSTNQDQNRTDSSSPARSVESNSQPTGNSGVTDTPQFKLKLQG